MFKRRRGISVFRVLTSWGNRGQDGQPITLHAPGHNLAIEVGIIRSNSHVRLIGNP